MNPFLDKNPKNDEKGPQETKSDNRVRLERIAHEMKKKKKLRGEGKGKKG